MNKSVEFFNIEVYSISIAMFVSLLTTCKRARVHSRTQRNNFHRHIELSCYESFLSWGFIYYSQLAVECK